MARRVDKQSAIMRLTAAGTLAPVSSYDAEVLGRLASGSEVEVTFHQTKSDKQARLFWVILGKVVDSTEYPTAEALATALKIRLRYVDSVSLIGGGFHVEPKSMRDMDKQEFSTFFDGAMRVIAEEVIPGLDVGALLNEGRMQIGSAP